MTIQRIQGLFLLVPAAATVGGALTAFVHTPGKVARSAIHHLAAGVVFSVVAVELLPDLTATHAIPEVIGGFLAGVIAMMVIRAIFREEVKPKPRGKSGMIQGARLPVALLTGIGVDILLDGFLLGLGASLGAKEGLLLAGALTLELYSLGLAIGVDFSERRLNRQKTVVVAVVLSLLLIAGTLTGYTLLGSASRHVLAAILSFGCAALLFLVTEELLVEAHELPETPLTTGSFFAGFLFFLVLGMLL